MHFAGKFLALWQSISRPTLQWAVRGGGQWLMVGWVQHTVQLAVPTPPSYFCRLFQCVTPGPHFMTQLLWPGDFVTVALRHLGYTFFLGGGWRVLWLDFCLAVSFSSLLVASSYLHRQMTFGSDSTREIIFHCSTILIAWSIPSLCLAENYLSSIICT